MGNPKRQMLIGGMMAFLSWLVILAMVVEILPQIIEMYMAAYIVSLVGFAIGMFGAGTVMRENLKRHRREKGDDEY
ncbi:MAG: hypothetical protein M0R49_02275 [Limnochordia bacterium]|jgi:polyferredoxin|nr:hypothetical protein [Limnochordia bacterium]